jgi:hypothetical protein
VSRPVVSDYTERLYGNLPEFMQDSDEVELSGGGYPLLRYLSLLGDQAGDVDTLADRIAAGELADPVRADDAWLPWLAQMVGVQLDTSTPPAAWRDAITGGSSGWATGTRASIATAARRALTGTQYVEVRSHNGKPETGGDSWTIQLVVRADEAPAPLTKVADAVIEAGAKPAGYLLSVSTYAPTWATVDAIGATWDPIDAKTTWQELDSTGA